MQKKMHNVYGIVFKECKKLRNYLHVAFNMHKKRSIQEIVEILGYTKDGKRVFAVGNTVEEAVDKFIERYQHELSRMR